METQRQTLKVLSVVAKTISKERRRKGYPFVPPKSVVGYCPPDAWEFIAKDRNRLVDQIGMIYDQFEIGPLDNSLFRKKPQEERDHLIAIGRNPWW